MTESDIIAQARQAFGADAPTLLDALEAFYMSGSADEQDGEVETFGHFYRVDRWIVWTDNQGFHSIDTFETEAEAIQSFKMHSAAYAELEK